MLLQPAELRAQRLLLEAPGREVGTGQPRWGNASAVRFDNVIVGSGVCCVIAAVRVR